MLFRSLEIFTTSDIRTISDGPFGGNSLEVGGEQLGELIDAPLSSELPWSSVGISDFSVIQSAYQLTQGMIWLPTMEEREPIPISTMNNIVKLAL